MSKNYVSVLDIGSSKLTVMIGEKGVNNTFNVRGAGEVNYAGFYEGVFLEPENLQSAIKEAISKAETNSETAPFLIRIITPRIMLNRIPIPQFSI